MRKLGQILLSSALVSSFLCGTPTYAKSVDVWDVDPIYEWEDIDVNFNDNFLAIRAFYSNTSANASYDAGGVIIQSHGLYGLMDGQGEVKEIPHWTSCLPTSIVNGKVILENGLGNGTLGTLNEDYTVEHNPSGIGGTSAGYYAYWSSEGDISDADPITENRKNTFTASSLINNSRVDENGYILYQSYLDPDIVEDIPSDYVESYVLLNGKGSRVLKDIPIKTAVHCISNKRILISDCEESSIGYFNNSPTNTYSNYQFYTLKGKQIGDSYEQAYGFYEGLAPVKKDGKWGYINKKGKLVVDCVFDKATPITDGKAWVTYNGRTGRLNIQNMIDQKLKFNNSTLKVKKYKAYQDDTLYIQSLVGNLRMRSEPSTSGSYEYKLEEGITTSAYEKKEADGYTWYLIDEQSGTQFWVADKDGSWIQELS